MKQSRSSGNIRLRLISATTTALMFFGTPQHCYQYNLLEDVEVSSEN